MNSIRSRPCPTVEFLPGTMAAKIADTFQALLTYPKGFLVSYSTSFGSDCQGFTRYMGKQATLINIGGEGSPRYQVIQETKLDARE